VDPLVKDLKSKNTEKRLAALDKLADFGSLAQEAGADVVEFGVLKSPPSVQEAATATLEKIDPEAHKLIITLLIDNSEQNRLQAIQGLEALGRKGKSAMPALKHYYLQLVTTSRFGGQNAGIVLHAMTKIAPEDKAAIDTVLSLVSRPVPLPVRGTNNLPARSLTIRLLPELKIDNSKRVAVLIAALNDPICRAQAATELGKVGPDAKEALPLLTRLKLDPDRAVRQSASTAIDLIKQ
jgi:HEAT repeat protein